MTNPFSSLSYRGAGIGLRDDITEQTMAHKDAIEVLEIVTETFFSKEKKELLRRFAPVFPIIPHGVDLSIGSVEDTDKDFLREVKEICTIVGAQYYSDHFAFTHSGPTSLGHLSPIWFTKTALSRVVDKINMVQDTLEIPLVLENITSYFAIPNADFSEEEFITKVCEKTKCGLLLDVTNVFINFHNFKQDPYIFLKRFPLDNVVQLHLAGGYIRDGWFVDSHSEALDGVNEGLWPIIEWVLSRTPNLKAVIIERDENFKGNFEDILLKDLKRVRGLMKKQASAMPGK